MCRFAQLGALLPSDATSKPDRLVVAEMRKTYAALLTALKSMRNGRH
jgi:hypothetical protein